MFSRRTSWDLSPNPLAAAAASRRAAGRPLIDLTESNPTRVGLGFPADALLRALDDPDGARYEPDPAGLPQAREAVSRYYRSRGFEVPAGRIVVTASTSEAYGFLFKLLCDPGDQVLVPEPSYPLFGYLAALDSVGVAGYPLAWDGEWHLQREALLAALTPRARAIVVVSPNNPTGSFLKRDELDALAAACRAHDLALICDEVFSDFALRSDPRRVETVADWGGALAFTLGGLSKTAALPQLKIGWIVVSGPGAQAEAALQRLEIIADTYLSPNTPAQLALPAILEQRQLAQEPLRARVRQNLAALEALRGPTAAWGVLAPEGGWSAILRVPRTRTEQDWAVRLVEDDGVLVHPGFFFDFPSEAFLAVSLIVEPREFLEGMERVARRIDAG